MTTAITTTGTSSLRPVLSFSCVPVRSSRRARRPDFLAAPRRHAGSSSIIESKLVVLSRKGCQWPSIPKLSTWVTMTHPSRHGTRDTLHSNWPRNIYTRLRFLVWRGVLLAVHTVVARRLTSHPYKAGTENAGFSPDQALTSPSAKRPEVFDEMWGDGRCLERQRWYAACWCAGVDFGRIFSLQPAAAATFFYFLPQFSAPNAFAVVLVDDDGVDAAV
ncbi:unnamed protein product [Ectocarpus sp. 4 AP-2014]